MWFDGSNYVTLPPMTFGGEISIGAWVKYQHFAEYSSVIHLGNGPTQDVISLGSTANGGDLIFMAYRGRSPRALEVSCAWPLNEWVYVVVTLDSIGTMSAYINEELIQVVRPQRIHNCGCETKTMNMKPRVGSNQPHTFCDADYKYRVGGCDSQPGPLALVQRSQNYIGRSTESNFEGEISDVWIYGKALTDGEIHSFATSASAIGVGHSVRHVLPRACLQAGA
jgi:hypothetical protein